MRTLFIPVIFLICLLLVSCRDQQDISRENEPADPDISDQSGWSSVPAGLHAGFGSLDIAYSKSVPPSVIAGKEIFLHGWKGEKVYCQLLLWSNQEIPDISINVSYPQGDSSMITSSNVELRVVKYVLSDEFLGGCGHRIKDSLPVHISPDMLDPYNGISLDAFQTRPVWVTLSVPREAEAGIYQGSIMISSVRDTINLPFIAEVLDLVLPDPADWKFHLDLWQNPYAVARYHNVEPWSEEHWDLMEPLYRMLAEAGQKCITTTLNDMPWGGQTFDPFGSMVGWLRNSDGSWDYDYSLFDQYVNFMMEWGITDQINCYSMVPWHNRFTWFDQDSAKYVEVMALPGTPEYEDLWEPFLYQFREHLREMGWLEITTIAMDERKREDMLKIIGLINRTVPEIGITLAGGIQENVDDYIYDLSIAIGNNPSAVDVEKRVSSGKPTTFYTCCARPEHPNNFTFSPPADNAIIGWFAAAKGYSGFLRWAYNSWVEDPVYDSRFRTWPSGDTYLVYPGARSSVRFERLREGIQDYEKIRIVRDKLSVDPSESAIAFEKEIDEFMSSINLEALREFPSSIYVNKGKGLLYRISKYLEQF